MIDYITALALMAVMGLLMGCAEIPRVTVLTTDPPCYVRETAKELPILYCAGQRTESIPSRALAVKL